MFRQLANHANKGRRDLHRAESGAVILLVLAGFLVLILVSLAMHDAGTAAQEEIRVQNAADAGAYSQSVVKARSMNMIAYANTAKRMFFGNIVVYNMGVWALGVSTLVYVGRCAACLGMCYACYRAGTGGVQAGAMLLNSSNIGDVIDRAEDEIRTLDDLQKYLADVSPWWSFTESLMRGRQNGATVTSTWPPPPADLTSTMNTVREVILALDGALNTNVSGRIPGSPTGAFDRLPASKRQKDHLLEFIDDTLNLGMNLGLGPAKRDYCRELWASPEHLAPAIDHVINSAGGGFDYNGISTDGQTLGFFALLQATPWSFEWICSIASDVSSFDAWEEVMDYRVDGGPDEVSEQPWLQSTASLTLAYRASGRAMGVEAPDPGDVLDSGSSYSSGARREFENFNLPDHAESPQYQSSGTWSMARSEVLWRDQPGILNGVSDLIGTSSFQGIAQGLMEGPVVYSRGTPHMWTPRWTARLRPVYLPGEELEETLSASVPGVPDWALNALFDMPATEEAGLGNMLHDTAPYLMVAGAVVSALDTAFETDGGNFDMGTAITDFYYLMASASTFDADRMEGIEK